MGFKDAIHNLHEATDLSLLVTEELHQVYSVDGFKRKNLRHLLDTFAQYNYRPVLNYVPVLSGWDIQRAGRLSAHIQAPVCVPLRLEPVNDSECLLVDHYINVPETAIQLGQTFFGTKFESLKRKIPEDWQNVCEYIGRLVPFYRIANIEKWQWYLCTKSGTTLNFHLMPDAVIDPSHFLQVMGECRRARVNMVQVYPYTVEIVFHAFSKIERLPFNRRHRKRYEPYGKR